MNKLHLREAAHRLKSNQKLHFQIIPTTKARVLKEVVKPSQII